MDLGCSLNKTNEFLKKKKKYQFILLAYLQISIAVSLSKGT